MPVRLGDHVEFHGGIILLFRRFSGQVIYVPGISPKNDRMEFNGLAWVGIEFRKGSLIMEVVDPDSRHLIHNVKLLRRGTGVVEGRAQPAGLETDN